MHFKLQRHDLLACGLQLHAVALLVDGGLGQLGSYLRKGGAGWHVSDAFPAGEARDIFVDKLLYAGIAPVGECGEGDFILQRWLLVPGAVRDQAAFDKPSGKVVSFEVKSDFVMCLHQASVEQFLQGGCHGAAA